MQTCISGEWEVEVDRKKMGVLSCEVVQWSGCGGRCGWLGFMVPV